MRSKLPHSGSGFQPLVSMQRLEAAATLNVSAKLPAMFERAKPVWIAGQEKVMNDFVGFRAVVTDAPGRRIDVRLTASSLYRITVNGRFIGHGPVRAPHGHYRVDEWNLNDHLRPGKNVMAIEVAGYNVNSYYLLDQPAFLQAEIVADGESLAATGDAEFTAIQLDYRVRKVQRFSFQRPFIEAYRLTPDSARWRDVVDYADAAKSTSVQPQQKLLPRGMSYPGFDTVASNRLVATGTVSRIEMKELKKDRSLTNVGPKLRGYAEAELELVSMNDAQSFKTILRSVDQPIDAGSELSVDSATTHIVDFGCDLTGFVGATIRCKVPTRLILLWEEVLEDGDVKCLRTDCANLIDLTLEPGEYRFESIEPYTLRYLKPLCLEGSCTIGGIYIREYASPDFDAARFSCSDPALNRIWQAAVQTLRQNAADLFTDCPGRERAGWLCDSFFSGRAAFLLSGNTRIEKNFLENYLLAPQLPQLPSGMLPMCYPADHDDGVFIPQWPMWLILELEEYLQRSGDRAMIDAFRPKMEAFIAYFDRFTNSDGLLEGLEGWRFIEWSKASDFTLDVNYPTNMLFAGMLESASRLYGRADWRARAAKMRQEIEKQSFNGEWFIDNALGDKATGRLAVTTNRSEACQYYAFFFDFATPTTLSLLWHRLRDEFGPQRKQTGAHPEIHPANAFIGNYLRLDVLSRYGQHQQVIDEIRSYFLKMADTTGTLWENDGTYASCNHGFASHVVRWILRDLIGLCDVDQVNRRISLREPMSMNGWATIELPVAGGQLTVDLRSEGEKRHFDVSLPDGFRRIDF
jgi:alpha-L-rhamnosidase